MIFKISTLIAFVMAFQCSYGLINSVTSSTSTAKDCDTVVVTISGTHSCPNDVITGVTHSVSGSTITISLSVNTGICIPPIPTPTFSRNYNLVLSAIATGSYTIQAQYNSSTSSSTVPLTITSCCPSNAKVGKDTALCNTNTLILNGNTPPSGSTASWSVISGGGTLSSTIQPNATLSQMSYGVNEVVWTMIDSICTTKDTMKITNYEEPTPAATEVDRFTCFDTTTINATTPSIGVGNWYNITPGVFISSPSSSSSLATFLLPGDFDLLWVTSNGICVSRDTLNIEYKTLTDTPIISETNLLLTSTVAPQYQWYKDGNVIPGETNMTYTVTANGKYKVLGSESGCTNGLFSNEIEILSIGINESKNLDAVKVYPNPSNGIVFLKNLPTNTNIVLYQLDGKEVNRVNSVGKQMELDYSAFEAGVYIIQIESETRIEQLRLVLTK